MSGSNRFEPETIQLLLYFPTEKLKSARGASDTGPSGVYEFKRSYSGSVRS